MKEEVIQDSSSNLNLQSSAPPYITAFVTSLTVCLIYLGFLSSRYNFDGTVFSFWIEKASMTGDFGQLFHPRHILYCPLGYLFYKLISVDGYGIRSILALQIFDVLTAFFTLSLFHLLCFKLTRNRFLSIVYSLLLAFSYGFWFFAIEPEMHSLNTLILLCGIFIMLRWSQEKPDKAWLAKSFGLGALGALAMSGHITNGLFFIPLCWTALFYLKNGGEFSFKKRLVSGISPAFVTIVTAFSLIALLYVIGYKINPLAQGKTFMQWVIGLADPQNSLGARQNYWEIGLSAIPLGLEGFYRDFIASPLSADSGHLQLILPWFIASAVIISSLGLYLYCLPQLIKKDTRLHSILLLAFIPLALFSMVWEPHNFEMKVALLPIFWLCAAAATAYLLEKNITGKLKIIIHICLAIGVLALFIYNFTTSICPGHFPENNPDLERAYFIRDNTQPDSVIYLAGVGKNFYMGKIYIIYFAQRQTRVVDWTPGREEQNFIPRLRQNIISDIGKTIYVLSELIEPGTVVDQLAEGHGTEPDKIIKLFKNNSPRLVSTMKDGFALYAIKPDVLH